MYVSDSIGSVLDYLLLIVQFILDHYSLFWCWQILTTRWRLWQHAARRAFVGVWDVYFEVCLHLMLYLWLILIFADFGHQVSFLVICLLTVFVSVQVVFIWLQLTLVCSAKLWCYWDRLVSSWLVLTTRWQQWIWNWSWKLLHKCHNMLSEVGSSLHIVPAACSHVSSFWPAGGACSDMLTEWLF